MESSTENLRPQVLQNTLQQISSSDAAECCVICLGNLTEQCEAQPCKHRHFDYVCLVTWLLHAQARCPLCNSDVLEVRYDLSDDRKQEKVYTLPERFEEPKKLASRIEEGYDRPVSRGNSRSSSNGYFHHSDRSLGQSEDEAIQRRRFVYQHNLYSLHVGSNRRQPTELRYRELSPQLFRDDPELVSRARKWISRELQVFTFLYTDGDSLQRGNDGSVGLRRKPSKVEFLLEYIIAILKVVDFQGSSGQAEDLIQEFLGRKYTQLFLHELKAWLRSPYRWLGAWDRVVQYNTSGIDPPLLLQDVGLQSDNTTSRHPERRTRQPSTFRRGPYARQPPVAR